MNTSEEIFTYHPLLRSIALRIVGSIEDAEDIVQDTFEKWLSIDPVSYTHLTLPTTPYV